jgi:hypothetical protein
MEKEFVTLEVALRAKKLGFDEPCLMVNLIREEKPYSPNSSGIIQKPMANSACGKYSVAIPLWQQVEDWLREKHSLRFIILPIFGGGILEGWLYNFGAITLENLREVRNKGVSETYPQARLAAITEALSILEKAQK